MQVTDMFGTVSMVIYLSTTLPRWLHQATDLKGLERSTPQSKVPQLCIRETKWTAPVLKQLHEELQNLRKETQREPCYLRIRNQKPVQEVPTPEVEGVDVVQEDQYQAIVFMQSLIKGRAIQMMVYEGRDTCKELILELKNSIGLLKKDKELRSKDKVKVRAQQREETIQSVMVSRLQGTLGKLQGQVVGSLLDFLNKELRRLLEERKAHAMCWINERERNIREAAEAGRRQKEIRRRKEHDEIFRQLVKVTQESVDLYLQDIITEGIEFASTEEAKDYVLNLAEKVEKEVNMIDKIYAMKGVGSQEELISDLVHHFVLPEVEKQTIRKNMADKQRQNLKSIHEAVYSQFEGLPKVGKDTSFSVNSSLPTVDGVRYSISMGYADSIPHGTVDSSLKPNTSVEHQNIVSDEQEHIDPDMIEKYLNMLAAQDQTQDETQIQEIYMNYPGYTRYNTFQNDLDTIPETEHETSTNITSTDSASETPLYPSGVEE